MQEPLLAMSVVIFPPQESNQVYAFTVTEKCPTRVTVNQVSNVGHDGQQIVVELLAVKVVT